MNQRSTIASPSAVAETIIYKLAALAEWEAAKAEGVYRGSAHDRRDGFIHFSTARQLAGTARKYFAHAGDLVLLAVDVDALEKAVRSARRRARTPLQGLQPDSLSSRREGWGDGALRWEPARGGELFPHLYADLPIGAVKKEIPIPLADDGVPLLPADLPK